MPTVLLCSDEPILAEGLLKMLSGVDEFSLASYCSSLEELRGEMNRHQPDLLLIDLTAGITFDVMNGLHEVASNSRIVLWAHNVSTDMALQAMSLGVRGILRKTLPLDTLLRCLTRVNEGELWFEKTLTDSIMSARRHSLTRREGQVISLLSQGLKNKELATAMNISEGTVKVYLSRLYQKLGVKDRFELALYGLKTLAPGSAPRVNGDRILPKPAASVWQPPRTFFADRARVQ